MLINQASKCPRFNKHPGIVKFGMESYIAVPVKRVDGEFFGTLCAMDSDPSQIGEEMFTVFELLSQLISHELVREETRRQAMELSRQAGRAEVAADVSHVVGNALNSTMVSVQLAAQGIRDLPVDGPEKLVNFLETHKQEQISVAEFFEPKAKGDKVLGFLKSLGRDMGYRAKGMTDHLSSALRSLEQTEFAMAALKDHTPTAMIERIELDSFIDGLLEDKSSEFDEASMTVRFTHASLGSIESDPYILKKIIEELLGRSCSHSSAIDPRTVVIRIEEHPGVVKVSVLDEANTTPAADLDTSFAFGATTDPSRSGLAMHLCVLAAQGIGGELSRGSGGYTLTLPRQTKALSPAA